MKKSLVLLLCLALQGTTYAAAPNAADAAQRKDKEAIRTLVKTHGDVNAAQADGTTALQWAAHWGDAELVNLLLGAGANAKATNRYGATPLSEAVGVVGSGPIVDALLKAGADANTKTTADGETVLMTAARVGNADAVNMLLARGAQVNARETYKGQTALMWAASEKHPAVVKILMDHGADWKVRSFDRETKPPKLSAASSISPIARGGFTALLFAAREGDIDSARFMIDGGADINYGDVDNTTALTVSIMNKQYSFAKYLLDRGADTNIVGGYGRTALYAMVDIRNEDWSTLPNRKGEDPLPSLDLVKQLLARGAKVDIALTAPLPGRSGMDAGDTTLGAGSTPLMRAARAGDAEVMKLLLAAGANPKLTVRDGSNALMFAAGVGYRDKNTRGTEAEALEAMKVAIAAGLDISTENSKGENALHGAASRGADILVQFLLDHGAKINAKTRQGYTPLDVAMGKSVVGQLPVPHDSTVALLQKASGLEGTNVK